MPSLLFLFLDGIGLGAEEGNSNPFVSAEAPFLETLLGGRLTARREPLYGDFFVFRHLDATLGYPGLPQSATGQATLLTGLDCVARMQGHYGPWPGPTLRRLLEGRGTLFSEVTAAGGRALLANAYPPAYFTAIEGRRARTNVPVHAALAAGLSLADLTAYSRGEALAADLSGEAFAAFDPDLPVLSSTGAAGVLTTLASRADFTFFDYWLSDRIGHRGSFTEAVTLVERLDTFLGGLVASLGQSTLLVTSDHGNLEDKGTRSHTTSPVPLLAFGPGAAEFAAAESLLDVAPGVRRVLGLPPR